VFEPVPIETISIGTDSPFPSQITQQKDVIELQHPRGFRGRYGHPDYPLPHKQAHVQLWPLDPTVRFDTSFEEAELLRQKQLRYVSNYCTSLVHGKRYRGDHASSAVDVRDTCTSTSGA
jgi:hypothetical protein